MKLMNLNIKAFLDEVDSSSPAPGGGSVSALVSILGCCLGRMVAHLTFNKKSYNTLENDEKTEFEKNFDNLKGYREKLEELVDRDTEAYSLVMSAYKLPKESEEEKKVRKEKIQESLKKAVETPSLITEYSYEAIKSIECILKHGNKNAITDIAVGTILLFSGIEGGILNVKINLLSIEDEEFKNKVLEKLNGYYRESSKIKESILEIVNQNIGL